MVVSAPGYRPGVCARPVSLLDLYPTLNDLCGLDTIKLHDGVSLAPLLRDPQRQWKRPAVIEFRRGNAAVRKYVPRIPLADCMPTATRSNIATQA